MKSNIILIWFLLTLFGCKSYEFYPCYKWIYPIEVDDNRMVDQSAIYDTIKISKLIFEETFNLNCSPVEVIISDSRLGKIEYKNNKLYFHVYVSDSTINLYHLCLITRAFTHELSEFCLAFERMYGGTLYGADPSNRWIGEGISDYMGTKSLLCAREYGYPVLENGHPMMRIFKYAFKMNKRQIRVSGWTFDIEYKELKDRDIIPDDDTYSKDKFNESLMYIASEWLISEWVKSATAKGHENPIHDLWEWLLANPQPRYNEITEWMESYAGISVREMAEAVDLSKVQEYYESIVIR